MACVKALRRVDPGVGWTLADVTQWCGRSADTARYWRDRRGEGFPAPIGRSSNAFTYDPGLSYREAARAAPAAAAPAGLSS